MPEHGTAVAGVAAAVTGNGLGVAGACPACPIVPVRLITGELVEISSDVEAFAHVIDHGAAVCNNSWGYDEALPMPFALEAVLSRAESEGRGGKGMLVVFAAGNEDREVRDFELQGHPSVVTVGATDRYGHATPYTNYGAGLDLVAPVGAVTTTLDGDYTYSFGGTSSAAPVVAGVLGLAVAAAPDVTAARLRELLVATAKKSPLVSYDEQGHNDTYGYGQVQPLELLQVLSREPAGDAGVGDAGEVDGGEVDAGGGPVDAGRDAGTAPDAGPGDVAVAADQGPAQDAARSGTPQDGGDDGCSCAQPGHGRSLPRRPGALVWLLAVVLATKTERGRRAAPSPSP